MSTPLENLFIAIDGPSASGKSTVSKEVARKMGFVYVDSGSLYRAVTWAALQADVSTQDSDAVMALLAQVDWGFTLTDQSVIFTVDGQNPGVELRSEAVRESVSDVAAMPEVRSFVVEKLRETMTFGHVVMEGRDIGSVVCPHTPFKYYLDADPEERARRRHQELLQRQENRDVEHVLASLKRRDAKDTGRETAPLQIALGARVINSTGLSIDEVVDLIIEDIKQRA